MTRRGAATAIAPSKHDLTTHPVAVSGLTALGLLAAIGMLLPLLGGTYGVFIDELYYLACSKRVDLGFVDHPPLSIAFLRLWSGLFGDSLPSIRIPAVLASVGLLFLTGVLAQRLGASRPGQLCAAALVVTIPTLNVVFSFYSMNAFEPLLWSLGFFLLIELTRTGNARLWLCFGLFAGAAFLNKHTAVILLAGLGLGIVSTPQRRLLRDRHAIAGAVIAFVVVLPHLYWLWQHDWITLEFYAAAGAKNISTSPFAALGQQALAVNPCLLPVIVAGLAYLGGAPAMREYRWVAYTFGVVLLSMLFSNQSRPDRIVGVYPVIVAAGMAGLDHVSTPMRTSWPLRFLVAVPFAFWLLVLPVLQPLFPPSFVASYNDRLGLVPTIEKGADTTPLPQWLADRLGWREMAEEVSRAYLRLPEGERRNAAAVAPDYGHAGAIEYYSDRLPLPRAFSPHNSYYLWGPPPPDTRTVIAVRYSRAQLEPYFGTIVEHAVVECARCRGFRQRVPIFLASRRKQPLARIWEDSRHIR